MNNDEDNINVLIIEADKHPYLANIPDTLEAKQEIVGGGIEAVYPFEDNVCCICNDEGKLWGLVPNRMLWDKSGEPYDILCGTFMVAGLTDADFGSLSEADTKKYTERFWEPEFFALDKDREVSFDDLRTTERTIEREEERELDIC